jgi:hypothetical protein
MKSDIEKTNLFTVSNQKWKVLLFIVLLINQFVLFGLMFWSIWNRDNVIVQITRIDDVGFGLINVLYGIFLFMPWTAFSLKCPKCRKALVWYIMRHGDQCNFVPAVMNGIFVGCPACKVDYLSMSTETPRNT